MDFEKLICPTSARIITTQDKKWHDDWHGMDFWFAANHTAALCVIYAFTQVDEKSQAFRKKCEALQKGFSHCSVISRTL